LIESKWEEESLYKEFTNSSSSDTIHKETKEISSSKANKYWNPKIYVENVLNDPKNQIHYKIKKYPKKDIYDQFKSLDNIQESEEEEQKLNEEEEEREEEREEISTELAKEVENKYQFFMFEYRKIKGHFFEKLELSRKKRITRRTS
jgi:hypothetical protein